MFDNLSRETIQTALTQALQDPSSFAQADTIYRNVFRRLPITANLVLEDYAEDRDEFDLESTEWFKQEFNVDYHPNILTCELCNYKGEGVGDNFVLFEQVKHLPIFQSKNHSMII